MCMAKSQKSGTYLIDEYLVKHGLQSQELAERCEMTKQQMCHIRSGRRKPTLSQAAALKRVCRIPIDAWL